MNLTVRLMAITLLLGGAVLAQAQAPRGGATGGDRGALSAPRTWTDSTGRFKVEARLVKFEGGQVTLEKADGRTITLPLARLSDADQALLRASVSKPPPAAAKTGDGGSRAADWSGVRNLTIDPPETWSLTPEVPVIAEQPLASGAVALGPPLGGKKSIFEKVSVLGFDRRQGQALLTRNFSPPGGEKKMAIERCDLATGSSLGTFEMPQNVQPLDVDPTGRRLVVRSKFFGFGKNGRVDVWDIGGLEPTLLSSWEPYAEARSSGKDVSFAAFVDADRLLTVGNRQLTLWDVPGAKAIYTVKVKRPPAISAGRKYLAVAAKDGMFVLEAATGKTLGQLPGEEGSFMEFAFRDDARRLAMISGGRLQVWDCEKGERYRDIFLQGVSIANDLQWVGDDYVLVGKSHVVDVERRMVLWKYDGMSNPGKTYAGRYWFMVGGGPNGKSLMQVQLPHEEAVSAVAAIAPEQLLAVKPGTKMRLQVQLGFSREHEQQITEALAARLRDNGITIAEDAPLVFTATAERGEKKSITYRGFGFRGGSSTVEVQQNKYSMAIQENGRDLWRTGSVTTAPPLLHLREGETVQQAVARYGNLNLSFFLKTPLPRLLARPGKYGGAYGVSRVTISGIETTKRP
jgi:hypothetical protein